MQARLVVIPLFDGVQSLDVTGPLEVFTGAAERAAANAGAADQGYRIVTASPDGALVETSSGLGLKPAAACETSRQPRSTPSSCPAVLVCAASARG